MQQREGQREGRDRESERKEKSGGVGLAFDVRPVTLSDGCDEEGKVGRKLSPT